jgi:hypothetical protein
MPLKAHFNTPSYNFIEYNGRMPGANPTVYKKRNDRYYFEKLGAQKTKQEALRFMVHNFTVNKSIGVQDLLSLDADHIHRTWTARHRAMDYNFVEDIRNIRQMNKTWKEILIGDQQIPPILSMYQQEMITTETIIILNELFKMFGKWTPNIITDDEVTKLRNYRDFLIIDHYHFKILFQEGDK